MNYYIQGDPARAEEIKAEFKRLGYDTRNFDYSCGLFVTFNNDRDVHYLSYGSQISDIIKAYPDYKELELPVQPKFKVGDWLVYKYGNCFAGSFMEEQVVKVKDGVYYFSTGSTGSCKFIDETFRLWSIADAKDGDVLACPLPKDYETGEQIFIFKGINSRDYVNNCIEYYCRICEGVFYENKIGYMGTTSSPLYPATKEQRELLFAKMKASGYQWDSKKKKLMKIKSHYDIKNFKPFDKVLVRYYGTDKWKCGLFSHLSTHSGAKFVCVGSTYSQCIPFDGNKHLLGTTGMPDEMYINW